MITMNLFQSIQKDKKKGLHIREISRKYNIARNTVAKYYKMTDLEYIEYLNKAYQRDHAFIKYKDEICEIYQQNGNKVYTSSVFDLLEEKHGIENLPGTARTLRNYIAMLVETGGIMNTPQKRYYTPVDQLEYGKQLQVDFGQTVISSEEKVYIFAAVLSASRYRYAAVQARPFTTLDVIIHLIDCFEYIGGIPEQIAIDQDKTMITSENKGDIIFTKAFEQFKEEMGFDMFVCRKADPESKGKVENLVKFIKTSFFSARTFKDIDDVKKSLPLWLNRTANGKISQATGIIPANLLSREQEKLKAVRASIFRRDTILEREERKADHKGFISVGSSRYSVPKAFCKKTVWIYRTESTLIIYNGLAGEEIARHNLSAIPRQTVMNSAHFKDYSVKQGALKEALIKRMPAAEWKNYVEKNYRRYTRYFREQYETISRFLDTGFDDALIIKAVELCFETDGYSAGNLVEAYTYVRGVADHNQADILPALLTGIQAVKADARNPKVAKRDLSFYHSFINIVGGIL